MGTYRLFKLIGNEVQKRLQQHAVRRRVNYKHDTFVYVEKSTQTVQRIFRTGSDVIPVQTGSTLNVLGLTLLQYLIILCVHSVLFTEVLF